MTQLLWKIAWQFLQKLKVELPYVPAIPLLSMLKARSQRAIGTPTFLAVLVTVAKSWKPARCLQVGRPSVVYTSCGMLFSLRKEGNPITRYNVNET